MAARAGMQRVELVDELDAERAPVRPAGPRPPRRRRWPWLVVAVAAAGALLGVQGLLSAHGRAVDARIAAVPGLVGRVDATVAPAWQMSDAQRRFVVAAVRFGDEAVGIVTGDDGARSVVALDTATGRTQWTYSLGGPDALRAQAAGDIVQPGSCTLVPGPTPRAACYLTDGVTVATGGEISLTLRSATSGRLVVLDPAGSVVADRPAPLARSFGVTSTDVLLASVGRGQNGLVVAQDLLTGAARWQWPTEDPVVGGGVLGARLAFQPFAVGADVAVAEPSGRVTVLDGSGRVAHRPVTGVTAWTAVGDALVLTTGRDATTIVRPGAADVVLAGSPVRVVADDRSLPHLALTSTGGTLRAYDATTGAPRWQSAIEPQSRALVLRGRVYLLGAGAFVVVDGRTGVTLATEPPAPGTTLSPPVSDGRHVLVAQVGAADEPATLVAYRFDGARDWTAGLPPGTSTVGQLGRTLVAYDDAGLEVLGSRG